MPEANPDHIPDFDDRTPTEKALDLEIDAIDELISRPAHTGMALISKLILLRDYSGDMPMSEIAPMLLDDVIECVRLDKLPAYVADRRRNTRTNDGPFSIQNDGDSFHA